MNRIRFALGGISATLALAGTVTTASAWTLSPVRPANSYSAYRTGYGPTLAAAEADGSDQIQGDFGDCGPITLVSDGQSADGTWWATMHANCRVVT